MSLLPNQVLPETVPIGKVNDDGTVTINHTWYLLFYNMGLVALPSGNITPILETESFLPRVQPYPNPDPVGALLTEQSFAPKQPFPIPDEASQLLKEYTFAPRQFQPINSPRSSSLPILEILSFLTQYPPVSIGNASDILLNQVFGA